ncbi:MAG: PAS domain S-box protein [Deltaproteobacteria bacterium]|nr:MAG: PAS domain S-box protein [Deltaproteobacteria bacterium]
MLDEFETPQPKLITHILEIINSSILVVDIIDRIVFANSKAVMMFKAEKKKLEGSPLAKIFMPEDREVLLSNILKITRSQGEFEGEAMLHRPDGSKFMGLLSASSWQWEKGVGVVITIHDITKLKNIEWELRRSERMVFLGRMMNDISHQIRNPVLTIGGFSRRLAKTDIPKPEHIQAIIDESARLELLLNTLNEFIKLDRPKLEPLPVKYLVENIESRLMSLAEGHGAKWISKISSSLPTERVLADPKIFIRALEAVVINAFDAYEHEGTEKIIEFWVEPVVDQSPWACAFCVKDRGSGIKPSILPNIFSPFFTTKTGHIGMGLTFAHRIMEEQLGDIAIESSVGKGTVLTLYLSKDRRRDIRTKKINFTASCKTQDFA